MKHVSLSILVFLLLCSQITQAQTIKYVKQTKAGSGNGSSWANALPADSLQYAINSLSDAGGGQVWVAAGTYYPTQDVTRKNNPADARSKTFALRNKVAVYGGFAGIESSINARAKSDINNDKKISGWEFTNQTILSGNIQKDADSSNNVYHVVFQKESAVEGIMIDGCTVQEGNAILLYLDANKFLTANEWAETSIGGGLYANKIIIKNCIVKKNTAFSHGAGIYMANSIADSCNIVNNSFTDYSINSGYGAGVEINEIGSLMNCIIEKNQGPRGAGVHLNAGGLVQSCSISNNKGRYILETTSGGTFINCNIVNNVGNIDLSQASLVSCTVKNSSSIQLWDSPVLNSIIVDKISLVGKISIKYSLISPIKKDKDSLTNKYLNTLDQFGFVDTIDYKLKGTSPAFNAGMPNVGSLNQVSVDLYGNPRISYDRIDVGSHEFYSRRYVTENGAGNYAGTNWDNAMPASKLENAVDVGAGEVWLAGGTYYVGKNPLQLTDNVRIIGGFSAIKKETSIDQRERKDIDANGKIEPWEFANATIIKPNTNIFERYGRLIDGWFVGGYPVIDGITLRDAKQWENIGDIFSGGAISLAAGCIRNSIITNNQGNADDPNHSSCIALRGTAQIDNCLIKDNVNDGYGGGGLHLADNSKATFCVIRNNKTTRIGGAEGGGILMTGNALLGESLIYNNYNNGDSPTGGEYGGGVSLYGGTIRNSIITNNTTYGRGTRGGGVFAQERSLNKIINSIIVNNSAEGDGADGQDIGVSMNVSMINSIVSNQPFLRALTTENRISNIVAPSVFYGLGIDKIFTFKDNADLYGQFVNPTRFKGVAKTKADTLAINAANWHLNTSSWFINKGIIDNTIIQTPEIDADSTARVKHEKIDLGAYEYLITQPATSKIISTNSLVTLVGTNHSEKIQFNWSAISANRYLLFVKEGSTGSLQIPNGTSYTANAIFGKGSQLNGWYCVYNGTGTSTIIEGLLQGTDYKAMLVTANGTNYFVYNDSVLENKTIKIFTTKRTQTISLNLPQTVEATASFVPNVSSTSGLGVKLTSSDETVIKFIGGKLVPFKKGSVVITATQEGDTSFFGTSTKANLEVITTPQTITFDAITNKTVGDTDFQAIVSASSNLAVTLESSNPQVAQVLNNNMIHIVGAGTVIFTATQNGSDVYTAAKPVSYTFTVNQASQRILLNETASCVYGAKPMALPRLSTALLPIIYSSSNEEVAQIRNDSSIVIVGVGFASITATQAGNNNYLPAITKTMELSVKKQSQTILFNDLATIVYKDSAFKPQCNASSGLPLSFTSSNEAVARIENDSMIRLVGAGVTTITAHQEGNDSMAAAPAKSKRFEVLKQKQYFIAKNILKKLQYGMNDSALDVSTTANLPVSISSKTPNIIVIVNGKLHIVSTGMAIIRISQSGTAGVAVADTSINIEVVRASQSIVDFEKTINAFHNSPEFNFTASSTADNTVKYKSLNPTVAQMVGNKLRIAAPGVCKIVAYVPQSTNYEAVSDTCTLSVSALDVLEMPSYTISRDTAIDLNALRINNNSFTFNYVSSKATSVSVNEAGIANIQILANDKAWKGIDTVVFTAKDKTVGTDLLTFSIRIIRRALVEEIGLVTVDSATSTHCVVAWQRSQNAGIARYIVYRSSNTFEQWDSIGGVDASELGSFADNDVDVRQQAYQYSLVTVDLNKNHSARCKPHTTMHLQTEVSLQGKPQLSWNAYEGAPVKRYIIYRENQQTHLFDSIGSTFLTSFTDLNPNGINNYRVGIRFAKVLNLSILKTDTGPFSQSLSNMSEASLVAIKEQEPTRLVQIAPNPARAYTCISTTTSFVAGTQIRIVSVDGKTVTEQTIGEQTNSIHVSLTGIAAGFYTVHIDGLATQKLVIEN